MTIAIVAIAVVAVACSSRNIGPNAPTAEDLANETLAVQKTQCAIENQARCAHLIENRTLFARFYTPETLGGMTENEKVKGRRITTKFVVEAVAAIKQCNRVTAESITLIRGMAINGRKYLVKGTAPLEPQTSICFLMPQPEES